MNLADGTVEGGSYDESQFGPPAGPPSIPRMPPFNKVAFALAMALAVVDGIFVVNVQPAIETVFKVLGFLYGALFLWVAGRRTRLAWHTRSLVRQLSRLSTDRRRQVIRSIPDERAQVLVQRLVEEHGGTTAAGTVERFQFSLVDQRQIVIGMWIAAVAAAASLVPAFSVAHSSWQRLVIASAATFLASLAVGLRWLAKDRRRVFELSPFAISEIDANGRIRRLSWAGVASVRNRRWLARVELSDSRGDRIVIPHALLGIERLLELMLKHLGLDNNNQEPRTTEPPNP